jgi:mannose-6-phosphate isomerase-like protein (cupin superfamily)
LNSPGTETSINSKSFVASEYFTLIPGGLTLEGESVDSQILGKGDAFVIPPGMSVKYSDATKDLELIEVSVPGEFKTQFG